MNECHAGASGKAPRELFDTRALSSCVYCFSLTAHAPMSAFLRFALLLAALLPTVCAVRYASPPSCGLYAECQRTLHCLCVSLSERSLRSLCLCLLVLLAGLRRGVVRHLLPERQCTQPGTCVPSAA